MTTNEYVNRETFPGISFQPSVTMAHHRHHHHDLDMNPSMPLAMSHNFSPSEPLHMLEEEAILDVDEPPDNSLMFKRQPIRSPNLSLITNPLDGVMPQAKRGSLLTKGLSAEIDPRPRSLVSSLSTESVASTAELTSDGGLTSPDRTSSPSSPHLPITIGLNGAPALKKVETVVLAPAAEAPRKRCITFACGKPPVKPEQPKENNVVQPEVKKTCTIKFACPMRPKEPTKEPSATPKPTRQVIPDDTTPKKLTSKASFSRSPVLSKKKRPSEALRFHHFASKDIEDDEWVYDKPRRQSKLTVSDTLRKENEYRKLGEEVAAEAREAEREEDEAAMNAEDDDNDDDFDEDLEDENDEEDLDEDEHEDTDEEDDDEEYDTDGNESDNEAGFADSDDDEFEDNTDYQFWTPGLTTAATSTDNLEYLKLQRGSPSASSVESVIASKGSIDHPRNRKVRRPKLPKMRPGTPELPDSTDFVCGTLDEDRPLEAAYLSCMRQKQAAKRGVIPSDIDPTFPPSDPEDEISDVEDNVDSQASPEGTWAAGHFDDFEFKKRGRKGTINSTRTPSISPKRCKSPAPKALRNRAMAHTPPPSTRRLFGQSPRRNRSPAPRFQPASPPTSRHPSYDDRSMEIPRLAQRPNMTQTKSLPRTPNPFWKEHRRQRKDLTIPTDESTNEMHSRGPIDIIQGLENKRRRRKEKFWLTHCRKDAKEKEKERHRRTPGRGAKRMRELGLEAADRCKGYGQQRAPLVLSA